MHAGLGAQQAKGVFALDLERGALDAGGIARGFVFDLGLEALALAVAQVLAQQHAGPVAGLGAAGAGLDVDKTVQRVGRVVEHAAEFQALDDLFELGGFVFDVMQAGLVAFILAHLEQLGVVGEFTFQLADGHHHAVERFFLAAQLLGALGVVPDGGVFERGVDGSQAFKFGIVVKDTPVIRGYGRSNRPIGCQGR